MLKNQRRGIKGPIMHCRKCQCEVFGYTREHAKTVEHVALKNFLRVQCCNNTYFNRADLEEQHLSLIHLKVEMESLKEKEWKWQQHESSGQRTNMFLTLQDLQCIFYILVWAASVAAKNQEYIDLSRLTRDAS
ncbi:uncharacterized protein [Panulirus ornatus]|uniref:uncharacterized protein isoform X1 n=1 Tax=Panulirus ornatus TaxID=150431 RepID=UPI003A86937A